MLYSSIVTMDIGQLIDEKAPLPITRAVSLLRSFAAALERLHQDGRVWDLKISSVLISTDDVVSISGSQVLGEDGLSPKLNDRDRMLIDLASPESSFQTGQHDMLGDIYGFGIICYEMLTGSQPFSGTTVYKTMTKLVEHKAPTPSALRNDCPEPLSAIVMKAMVKDRNQRYATAKGMLDDLNSFASTLLK